MTLAFHGKTRRRQVGLLLGGLLASLMAVFAGVSLYQDQVTGAEPITIVDDGGPNDVSGDGQKDLTRLGIDYTDLPSTFDVHWNWDETSVSGGNSMDACSLYDTDSDGNANSAVCVSVHFTDGVPAWSTVVWQCSDNAPDKCTAPNDDATAVASSCGIGVSPTDPFAAGDSYPNDLQATCDVNAAEVGGSSARLINVCSYESQQPTSNPEDCVINPDTRAWITVIKHVVGGTATAADFSITLTATGITGGPATFPGAESPGTSRVVTAGSFSLTETLAAGYSFTSLTGTGCPDALGASATIAAGANVTCTITNTYEAPATRTLRIIKVTGTAVHPAATFDGSLDQTGGATEPWSALLAADAAASTAVAKTISTAAYQLTETGIPAGWTLDGYLVKADADGTATCTGTFDNAAPAAIPSGTGNYLVCIQNTYTPPARSVEVCKVVVGNGDAVAVGTFAWGFDVRPTGLAIIQGSNSAAEPSPDTTDGTAGTAVCSTVSVPSDKSFDVVEWTSRLTGWADAAGYPKYSIDGGARVANNTTTVIPAGTGRVNVTFYNKAVPQTREIVITKELVNLGGYVPGAADVPAFTLDPSEGTSCAAGAFIDADTWSVTCTVPFNWQGTVSETPREGWREVDCAVTAPLTFCNEPFGTIRIEKVDGVDGAAGPDWEFTVTGGAYAGGTATADQGDPFEAGVALSSVPIAVSEVLARSAALCAVANTYYTIASPPTDRTIDRPGEVQTWTFQNQPCGILGTGGVIIEKYLDLNGDGDAGDPGEGPLAGWTFTTTGTGIGAGNEVKQTSASGRILDYASGFDAGTILVTTETVQSGYHITAVTLDSDDVGAAAMKSVAIIGGETRVIRYYNQPLGGITVDKETYNVVDGVEYRNFGDDDGWLITVRSDACGIDLSDTTDADGVAVFAGLPLCTDYRVAEDLTAPGAPGYSPRTTAVRTHIVPTIGGATAVTFVNETQETTPGPTPTPVPPTPTPVPPTPTPVPPTETPVPPTATATPVPPTPESTVAGERTPRPATPVAPVTGEGPGPDDGSGLNLALLAGWLIVLAGGFGAAVAVRRRR